jgi:hypothetical protein
MYIVYLALNYSVTPMNVLPSEKQYGCKTAVRFASRFCCVSPLFCVKRRGFRSASFLI